MIRRRPAGIWLSVRCCFFYGGSAPYLWAAGLARISRTGMARVRSSPKIEKLSLRRTEKSMDYHPPLKLMEEVEAASKKKAGLDVGRMLVKGFMSGALLAYGTALAYKVSGGFTDGAAALVAGAVFPVGFAMIIL